MVNGETVLETPPRAKRSKDPQSTMPAQRAPKRGRKSKEAEELASNATKLETEAEEISQEAMASEKAAVEAMEQAQSLRAKAVAIAKQAEIAKVAAQEARQQADRAVMSTTKEGRDALKAGLVCAKKNAGSGGSCSSKNLVDVVNYDARELNGAFHRVHLWRLLAVKLGFPKSSI